MAWDLFPAPLRLIRQGDGSSLQWLNCAAATAAMHIVSERQGKRTWKGSPWPPTGASFRAATGDVVGGLLASQVDSTSNRVYGIDPDFQIAAASLVVQKLRDGYGVTFLRREGPIVDAGFNGSPGFRENHSAYTSGISGTGNSIKVKDLNPLYDGRRQGIPKGPQMVPWNAWVRSGELLVIRDDGTRMIDRYGPKMLYVGFTRVPYHPSVPPTKLQYSLGFSTGSFWTYDVNGSGQITGRHAKMFSASTSARCGAPSVFPWSGNVPRRLVRMSAGVLKGQYVAVPQGSVRLIEKEVA